MIKLILLAAVGYVFYRALKSWMMAGSRRPVEGRAQGPAEVDDVLVQDPVCKTYIAQRNGVQLRRGGEVITFCSQACRDRYLETHAEEP